MCKINKIAENICLAINHHSKQKSNQIVLLRLDALGDFIIWQDAAKEFKRKYPHKRIILICQKSMEEFAKTLSYFDEVCAVDLNKLQCSMGYFVKVLINLYHYSGAILIQTVYSRTWLMNVIAAMVPAFQKITVDGNRDNYPAELGHFEDIYDSVRQISPKPDFDLTKNAAYMRRLGFREFRSDLPFLPEYTLEEKKLHNRYFVVVLGTSAHGKEWRPECYGKVARYTCEHYRLRCCLLGTEQDRELLGGFRNEFGGEFSYMDMLGKTSIMEYIQLIREAELVISGDTSAAHIAAAVRTKSIVITGGWQFGRFFPYCTEMGKNTEYFPKICYQYMGCYKCGRKRLTNQCRRDERRTGKWSCILAVEPDMVIKEIDNILS